MRSRRVQAGLEVEGRFSMVMSIAVMAGIEQAAVVALRYREVAHLTLQALDPRQQAGRSVAGAGPADRAGQVGRAVRADPGGGGELVFRTFPSRW